MKTRAFWCIASLLYIAAALTWKPAMAAYLLLNAFIAGGLALSVCIEWIDRKRSP